MPTQTAPPPAVRDGDRRSRRASAAAAAPRTGPVRPAARPRPGRVGPLLLSQLVLVETIAALVLLGMAGGRIALIGCGALAVLLVLPALLRWNGLGFGDALRVRFDLRSRQRAARRAELDPEADPALVPVLEWEPALRVAAHGIEWDGGVGRKERREIGMVGDGTFLSALIRVEAPDRPLRPAAPGSPLPLSLLASGLDVDDIVLDSVQVLQFAQTAPAPHLPETALAARAYRELPHGTSTPALRMTWVAVRLDPELCRPAIAARGGGETGARKALQRAVDQLAARLGGAGLRATVLDAAGVTAAIGTATLPHPVAATHGRSAQSGGQSRRTVEGVKSWRCDDRWHRSYWISSWPRLDGAHAPAVVDVLTGTPSLGSSLSVTLRGAGGGAVALSGHVRVTARGESELTSAARQLETRARSAGVSLLRLDHEQLPGLLATLPLGGTIR